jgi:hypothetical protein
LRWLGLQRRFFRHPVRRVRCSRRSCNNKVRKAGWAKHLSQRAGGEHVSNGQVTDLPLITRRRGSRRTPSPEGIDDQRIQSVFRQRGRATAIPTIWAGKFQCNQLHWTSPPPPTISTLQGQERNILVEPHTWQFFLEVCQRLPGGKTKTRGLNSAHDALAPLMVPDVP